MPPRLAHKKTRSGCKRCKARKVKCDEVKPQCTACTRHGVRCEYPGSVHGDPRSPSQDVASDYTAEHELELRLMHEWMAYTSETLSTTVDFWKIRAPLLALQNRFVFEALLALAALHASRKEAKAWSGFHGREIPVRPDDSPNGESSPAAGTPGEWKGWKAWARDNLPLDTDSTLSATPDARRAMLDVSRGYFSRALEGQQKAIAFFTPETLRPGHLCAMLVTYYSLFTLSEAEEDGGDETAGLMSWIRCSRGMRLINDSMGTMPTGSLRVESMHGEPDLSDVEELFHPIHMEPFKYLLSNVNGDEVAEEDRIAYEHTLSYVGLIYKGVVQGLDSPLATGRRCNAMPTSVPLRFSDLVEANRPRALAIMAHVFATMKLVAEHYPWFKGVAERQIPVICSIIPPEWAEFVQWPVQVIRGTGENQHAISPANGMTM